jgi:hypothetical protein
MHSYIKDKSAREKVPAKHYNRGFKYDPMNDHDKEHTKAYLHFLRKSHPEETGQIRELERKLYAPSPKAIALKEEDKRQRAEEKKNRKPWETDTIQSLEEAMVESTIPIEAFYLSMTYASKLLEFPEALDSCKHVKDVDNAIGTFAFYLADFISVDLEKRLDKKLFKDAGPVDSSDDIGLITTLILNEMSTFMEQNRLRWHLDTMVEYLKTKRLKGMNSARLLSSFLGQFAKKFRYMYTAHELFGTPYSGGEGEDENADSEPQSILFDDPKALLKEQE